MATSLSISFGSRPPFFTTTSARRRRTDFFPVNPAAPRAKLHPGFSLPRFSRGACLAWSGTGASGGGSEGGSINKQARVPSLVKTFNPTACLVDFVASNFLPIALLSGITLGLASPTLGCLAHRLYLSRVSTFGIFFFSGLMLQNKEIGDAIEAWPAGLFGLSSILLFTPCFSRLLLQIHLSPQAFCTGLAVFYCMPTTLSSGVALTQLARGNSALSLAMTVISNLLCIFLVPFSLTKLIGIGVGESFPTMQYFKGLIVNLLVPLVLGKVIHDTFKGVSNYVDQNRPVISMIGSVLLSLVPWMQVSKSRTLLLSVQPINLLIAVGLGMALHIASLAMNSIAMHTLSIISGGGRSVFSRKENTRAVIIVASQKTLPVMVTIVELLGGALGDPALLILPCVAAHINQIIIDSCLVNCWLHKDKMSAIVEEM